VVERAVAKRTAVRLRAWHDHRPGHREADRQDTPFPSIEVATEDFTGGGRVQPRRCVGLHEHHRVGPPAAGADGDQSAGRLERLFDSPARPPSGPTDAAESERADSIKNDLSDLQRDPA
jgi:hypothetical protein